MSFHIRLLQPYTPHAEKAAKPSRILAWVVGWVKLGSYLWIVANARWIFQEMVARSLQVCAENMPPCRASFMMFCASTRHP